MKGDERYKEKDNKNVNEEGRKEKVIIERCDNVLYFTWHSVLPSYLIYASFRHTQDLVRN